MPPNPYMQGSESITQAEHISPEKTGDNITAKRVAVYVWNGTTWERQGSGASGKATNGYSISAISETATYKYFFFEDASLNWYILRKTLATNVFEYTKGTGGYESVYVDATSGPSGSPTFDTYGATF
jgi:hypothetical protein